MLLSGFLGLFVGAMLAITGAGGAILSLPLLVFFLHMKMVDAAPVSLMAITFSAGLAAAIGLKHGIVRYKAATLLAVFGMLLAPLGVLAAHQLPEKVLGVLFSMVLFTVAWRSFQKIQTPSLLIGDDCEDPNGCDEEKPEPACSVNPATSKLFWTAPCTKRLILTGGFSGFLSGLLGVGGGFIIVPTLHSISNLETKSIVATSLAVIALVSTASVLSYAGESAINWAVAIPFVFGSMLGMLSCRLIHHKISSKLSLIIFSTLAMVIAIAMLVKMAF
jgi:uncharacterized membrane protein YfcA